MDKRSVKRLFSLALAALMLLPPAAVQAEEGGAVWYVSGPDGITVLEESPLPMPKQEAKGSYEYHIITPDPASMRTPSGTPMYAVGDSVEAWYSEATPSPAPTPQPTAASPLPWPDAEGWIIAPPLDNGDYVCLHCQKIVSADHVCPASKACSYCGEAFAGQWHSACAYKESCPDCGTSYYPGRGVWHSCEKQTGVFSYCFNCGTLYNAAGEHACTGEKSCLLCGESYKVTERHACMLTACFFCSKLNPKGEECHSYCPFCGVVEGSAAAHEKECEAGKQMEKCAYCGDGYFGTHECEYAPQKAVNGEVRVEIDMRVGKSHIRSIYMTGKVGDTYSDYYPEEILEYHYYADGRHYRYYKLEEVEDPNGGRFRDGMQKIDVWYSLVDRLTKEEAQKLNSVLPGAADPVCAVAGLIAPPGAEPEEKKKDETPVVIPPAQAEGAEAEEAFVLVMFADASTGEALWFASALSCPVGGSIELPVTAVPGFRFNGYYDYYTGARVGSSYTAQSADDVCLVAEYVYVGEEAEAGGGAPTPAPTAAAGPQVQDEGKLRRDVASEIARLVNEERTSRGLPALSVTGDNTHIAELRAEEITGEFSHRSASGILGNLGENIAAGQRSPAEFVSAWMNSTGHRSNILNAQYKSMGIGVYEHKGVLYAANVFSFYGSTQPTPTAAPTAAPTVVPTAAPTPVPTAQPTIAPTAAPTPVPTAQPTVVPTAAPTAAPTVKPVSTATPKPTAKPVYTVTFRYMDVDSNKRVGPLLSQKVEAGGRVPTGFDHYLKYTPAGYEFQYMTFNDVELEGRASFATITRNSQIVWYVRLSEEAAVGSFRSDYAAVAEELCNEARAAEGLPALRHSAQLEAAAKRRAKEIVESFSHTRPDGSDFWTVDESCVYGENLAKGTNLTGTGAHKGWMNSKGHRENILKKTHGSIGIACLELGGVCYYVQLFGR